MQGSANCTYFLAPMTLFFFLIPHGLCGACSREKNGITLIPNKNCELVTNNEIEADEEIVYFVHLYPYFICTSQFPIQFFFVGANFPVDGISVEMDYSDEEYQVSVDMFGFSPEYVGRYGCQGRRNHSAENSYYVLFDLEKRRGLMLGNGGTIKIEAEGEIVTLPCLLPVLSPSLVLLKDLGYNRSRHCASSFINNTNNKLELKGNITCPNLDGLNEGTVEKYHLQQALKLETHQLIQLDLNSSLIYKVSMGYLLNTSAFLNPWGKYICAVDLDRNFVKLIITRKEYKLYPPTWNYKYSQVKQHLSNDLNLSCMAREPIHHKIKVVDGLKLPETKIVYSDPNSSSKQGDFKYGIHFKISLREAMGQAFTLSCVYNTSHSIVSPVIQEWDIRRAHGSAYARKGEHAKPMGELSFVVLESGRLDCQSGIKGLAEVEVIYCSNPVECLGLNGDAFRGLEKKYPDERKRSKNYGHNDDVSKYPSGAISCSDDFDIRHATFIHGFYEEIYLIPGDVDIYSAYEELVKSLKMFTVHPRHVAVASNETKSKWDQLQHLNISRLHAKPEARNLPQTSPFLLLDSFTTFANDPIKFSIRCRSKSFFFEDTFVWSLIFKNGNRDTLSDSNSNFEVESSETKVRIAALAHVPDKKETPKEDIPEELNGYGNLATGYTDYSETATGFEEVATIRISNSSQIAAVTCGAKYRYLTSQLAEVIHEVELKNPESATILSTQLTHEFKVNDQTKYLACVAAGWPKPVINWYRNDTIVPSTFLRGNSELILPFPKINIKDAGSYICTAENSFGHTSRTFTVNVTEPENSNISRTVLILTAVCVLILLLGAIVVVRKYRGKITKLKTHKLTKQEVDTLLNEGGDQMVPFSKDFEIPLDLLEFDKKVLGKGAYGVVMKGYLKNRNDDTETTVAIKSVKSGAEQELIYMKALLSELKVMIYTGKSTNIVRLYGANTTNIEEGKLYVVVEYCENGNLENFLRTYRSSFITSGDKPVDLNEMTPVLSDQTLCYQNIVDTTVNEQPPAFQTMLKRYENFTAKNAITRSELLKWSYEIASGMEYLGTKNVIHGDLATRNVLLTRNMVAKITDFGLAKQLYEYTHYIRKTKLLLPWRQMALESLRDMCFSVQSDVWSFGVTLWEIYSLSQVPFAGIYYDDNFLQRLENGLRLGKPPHAPDEIYSMMSSCWDCDPQKRPSFESLKVVFEEMASRSASAECAESSTKTGECRISLKGQDELHD